MQLTDAEIREILMRRKQQKIRRQRRKRRRMIIFLILVAVLAFALYKILDRPAGTATETAEDKKAASEPAKTRGIIFLDPGHGGMDSGSDDDKDRFEKDDTLRLALAVRDYLREYGYKVEMSRTEDVLVDRIDRGKMANKCGAQLFISIHRNKAAGDGKGVEGFIPKEDDPDSRLLGESIIHELSRVGFAKRTIRAGTLYSPAEDYDEIAATKMPSVLVEVGFLSSTYDNSLFDRAMNRNARAMARAIDYTFMSIHEPKKAKAFNKERKVVEKTVDGIYSKTEKCVFSTIEDLLFQE